MKITALCGNRKGFGAGEKVKEGFLFYGVYMGSAGEFINEGVKKAFPVLPYPANSSFTGGNNTVMSAEKAVDLIVGTLLVKRGFFHGPLPELKVQAV
jgi:hypothetical protein